MPRRSKLIKNTVMLYILTLSSYVFMFITVPYQTRVLGPEIFGLIGIVTAIMLIVGLVLDFGFMLYATGEISKAQNTPAKIRIIYSSVMFIKLTLFLFCTLSLFIASLFVPFVSENILLFLLYLLAVAAQSLLPDFLYRGMEQMTPITVRSVIAKSLFVILIFSFLKVKGQYLLVPLFLLCSNMLALILAQIDIRKRFKTSFTKVTFKELWATFSSASQFFFSRIATTIYGASSTLIIGATTSATTVGLFSSADKLVSTAKTGFSPIADSIYPYMIKNRDYRLLTKLTVSASLISMIGCMIVFFNARTVCVFLFGQEFENAAPILQALLPIVAITPAQYLLGFPALSPLNLQKHANYSIFLSAGVYGLIIATFIATSTPLTPVSVALSMVTSELASVLYRITILAKYKWRRYTV